MNMLFKVLLIYACYKWQGMKMFHLKKGRLMKFASYDLLDRILGELHFVPYVHKKILRDYSAFL